MISPSLRFALHLPTAGWYADTARVVELARAAEDSGWDGVFFWDHLMMAPDLPVADAWTTTTAVLARTSRIRSGMLVTPLARRRPWRVAQEVATLDRLSGGRLVLGAGLGGAATSPDFAAFGETTATAERAGRLDEALEIIDAFWSGEAVTFAGRHHRIDHARLPGRPVQRPRVPIWIAATWPHRRPLRRAARWDGLVPMTDRGGGRLTGPTPGELRDMLAALPPVTDGFDVAVPGTLEPGSAHAQELAAEQHAAGATWWLEHFDPWRRSPAALRSWVESGPPRAAPTSAPASRPRRDAPVSHPIGGR